MLEDEKIEAEIERPWCDEFYTTPDLTDIASVHTYNDVYGGHMSVVGETFTFSIPGPVTTGIVYKVPVNKNWKLTRKYIAGESQTFTFIKDYDGKKFVEERIKEMKYLLKYVGKRPEDLQVDHFFNSKGDFVWNVSIPRGTQYSIVANMVCIFTLSEVKE